MRAFYLLAVAFLTTAAFAETITGTVVNVVDGDTITVLDGALAQHRVRLAGIDAPESKQAFGTAARRHLLALVSTRTVIIEPTKKDKYGRWVATVKTEGRDISLQQIEAGFAWHYTRYAMEQPEDTRRAYAEAEARARTERRGLWTDNAPVPPWDYRARLRQLAASSSQ